MKCWSLSAATNGPRKRNGMGRMNEGEIAILNTTVSSRACSDALWLMQLQYYRGIINALTKPNQINNQMNESVEKYATVCSPNAELTHVLWLFKFFSVYIFKCHILHSHSYVHLFVCTLFRITTSCFGCRKTSFSNVSSDGRSAPAHFQHHPSFVRDLKLGIGSTKKRSSKSLMASTDCGPSKQSIRIPFYRRKNFYRKLNCHDSNKTTIQNPAKRASKYLIWFDSVNWPHLESETCYRFHSLPYAHATRIF